MGFDRATEQRCGAAYLGRATVEVIGFTFWRGALELFGRRRLSPLLSEDPDGP